MTFPHRFFTLACIILSGTVQMAHTTKFVPADHQAIRYFGRWDFSDPLHPRHSWPGTYITAEFTGTSIGVRMIDSINYYNVFLDGKFVKVFHGTKSGDADYLLADSLKNKRHTLRFSKRNIVFDAVFTFSGFLIDDGAELVISPVRVPPPVKIEFIGDSFTAAESNEATVQQLEWEARFPVTNIDKGFAVDIARHYDADYHTTCRSGIGMVCDWQGMTDHTMPMIYDRTLMESSLPVWNYKSWVPGIIVISLGLNDFSGLKDSTGKVSDDKSAFFRKAYHDFIAHLRFYYPGVKILAVAAFPEWIRTNVGRVVEEEKGAGYHDIGYATFDEFPCGYVANGHPTVATHRKMADQIIAQMDSLKMVPAGE